MIHPETIKNPPLVKLIKQLLFVPTSKKHPFSFVFLRSYVLTALHRLVFCPSSCLTWEAGMLGAQEVGESCPGFLLFNYCSRCFLYELGKLFRSRCSCSTTVGCCSLSPRRVLITCRRMILSHPQACWAEGTPWWHVNCAGSLCECRSWSGISWYERTTWARRSSISPCCGCCST